MMRHSLLLQIRILTLLAVSIGLLPAAVPAQEPDYPEPPHLADGPWLGHGVVTGPLRVVYGPTTFEWDGRIESIFHLQVENGQVTGEVTLDGSGTSVGTYRGAPSMRAESQFSGSGTAEGTAYGFTFSGTATSRTHMTSPMAMTNTDTEPLRIQVRITEATCTSARGEWIQDWNAKLRETGYPNPTLQGEFVAERQVDAVRQALKEYLDAVAGWVENPSGPLGPPPALEQPEGVVGEVPPGAREIVEGFANLVGDYDRMVEEWDPSSEASRSQAYALTGRAVELHDRLMADQCTAELVGDDRIQKFIRPLLGLIFRITVALILEHDTPLTGYSIEGLVKRGIALDAFDSPPEGSVADWQHARAEEVELGLQQQAERVLEKSVPPPKLMLEGDPVLNLEKLPDDAKAALRAGAERGWSFELYGERYWADNLLQQATRTP